MVHICEITTFEISKSHEKIQIRGFLKCISACIHKLFKLNLVCLYTIKSNFVFTQKLSYFLILQNNNLSKFDKNKLCLRFFLIFFFWNKFKHSNIH